MTDFNDGYLAALEATVAAIQRYKLKLAHNDFERGRNNGLAWAAEVIRALVPPAQDHGIPVSGPLDDQIIIAVKSHDKAGKVSEQRVEMLHKLALAAMSVTHQDIHDDEPEAIYEINAMIKRFDKIIPARDTPQAEDKDVRIAVPDHEKQNAFNLGFKAAGENIVEDQSGGKAYDNAVHKHQPANSDSFTITPPQSRQSRPDPYHVDWDERDYLKDEIDLPLGQIKEIGTLNKGPSKWLAHVVVTRDENDSPDQTEIRWLDSREEAEAALGVKQEGE